MSESHVLRWWAGEPDHPIIDELKSRPGEWAVLWEPDDGGPLGGCEAFWACDHHRRIEVHVQRFPGMYGPQQSVSARWIPDEEWADLEARRRWPERRWSRYDLSRGPTCEEPGREVVGPEVDSWQVRRRGVDFDV